jgi:hypothetical protein
VARKRKKPKSVLGKVVAAIVLIWIIVPITPIVLAISAAKAK